jgi:AraC-like DNA-binding protein/mannose-6-phosphate isomerase-like protein (cupin superfamily)
MAKQKSRTSLPPLDPLRYAPSAARPLRAKARRMAHDMDIQPHEHDWGQLVFSLEGAVRVQAEAGGVAQAFIVPPSRAVWIPAGVVHAVMAISEAELRTLYVHASAAPAAWSACRVFEVSPLLRELVRELALGDKAWEPARDALLAPLLLDELQRAAPLALGLTLPQDKRLRRLCEALLVAPQQHALLADWASEVGASERTLSRLFRQELGTSYRQWREQALLAQALQLASRGRPMALIAAELGYATPSAFSAMVRRSVGASPRSFFAT